MGSNSGEEAIVSGSLELRSSEAIIEIKIRTMDLGTYSLRVDKCVPVPALKEQIALVTGIVSGQQRLICRGKVLADDQLLSAYDVKEGHTLHMVVRPPIPLSSESLLDHSASDHSLSAGHNQDSEGLIYLGSFTTFETGVETLPTFREALTAVLRSSAANRNGSGIEQVDIMETQLEMLRANGSNDPVHQTDPSTTGNHSNNDVNPVSLNPQLAVIPDSVTTLSVNQETNYNGMNESSMQDELTPPALGGQSEGPISSFLAEMVRAINQLADQAAIFLTDLARHLDNQENVTDLSARTINQYLINRSGELLQGVGGILFEFGHTTMMLDLGQSPGDVVLNNRPADGTHGSIPRNIGSLIPPIVGNEREQSATRQAIPVRERVQYVYSGNLNSARGSNSGLGHNSGLGPEQQRIPESQEHQQNNGLLGGEGLGHAETVDTTSNTQEEAARSANDGGIFLSNLLRQIMPYIYLHIDMGSNVVSSERDTTTSSSSSSQDTDSDKDTLNQQADPSTPSDAKRQKRE